MKPNSLSTNQSVVIKSLNNSRLSLRLSSIFLWALILVVPLMHISIEAEGQTVNSKSDVELCMGQGKSFEDCWKLVHGGEDQCEKALNKVDAARGDFAGACRNGFGTDEKQTVQVCYNKIYQCYEDEKELGTQILYEEDFDPDTCSDRIKKSICPPGLHSEESSLRDEVNSASQDKMDALNDIHDITKNISDFQSDQAEAMADVQKRQSALQRQLEKDVKELQQSIQDALSSLDADVKKGYQELQKSIFEVEARYIEMRDGLRQAQSKIDRARDELNRICRAYAMQKHQEQEAQIAQRMNMEASPAYKVNSSSISSLSFGTSKAKKKRREKLRVDNYASYYNDCMNGLVPEGTAGVNAIKAAQSDYANMQTRLQETAVLMEAQRKQNSVKMRELESQVTAQKQQTVERGQQQMQQLYKDAALAYQDLKKEAALQQMKTTQSQMQMAFKMSTAQQRLTEASGLKTLAMKRLQCKSPGDEDVKSSRQDYRGADKARNALITACAEIDRACPKPQSQPQFKTCQVFRDGKPETETRKRRQIINVKSKGTSQ